MTDPRRRDVTRRTIWGFAFPLVTAFFDQIDFLAVQHGPDGFSVGLVPFGGLREPPGQRRNPCNLSPVPCNLLLCVVHEARMPLESGSGNGTGVPIRRDF